MVILQDNVEWDCFQTLILLEILRIQKSGDPRLYVCQAPGALTRVSTCGSMLGPCWVHYGSIFGQYLDKNHYLDKNIGLPC